MSESNLSSLAYVAESTWGVTPASPEFQALRFTSADIRHAKGTVESAEIRSDRMTADLAQVTASAEGTMAFELSYGSYDDILSSAMYAPWVDVSLAGVTPLTVAGQVITGTAADFDDLIPLVGGWVKIAGATTPGNNGLKRIQAVAGDGSTLTLIAGSLTGSDTGETMTFTSGDLRNGIVEKSFTVERNLPHGGTDYFQLFTGIVASQFSLDAVVEAIVTGSFNFVGALGADGGSTTADNAGGYTAANANPVMTGTNEVSGVYLDTYSATAPTATAMIPGLRQVTFAINNGNRALKKLGTLGAFDLGVGEMALTGSMDVYFESNVLFAEFVAHTYKSFVINFTDSAGNIYVVTVPRLNLSDGNSPIDGKNADVMQKIEWRGIYDSHSGAQMIINRFPA